MSTPGSFNGLGMNLGNLSRLSNAQTRSISAENPTGARGQGGRASDGTTAAFARELGPGWKLSPSIPIPGQTTAVLAEIDGPGAIQHIWMTVAPAQWRRVVLRCYWDGEESPSVEVPLGDFFAADGARARTSIRCPSPSIQRVASTATGKCRSASMRGLR